jgi:deferrochelatase/peroxidase EfeB
VLLLYASDDDAVAALHERMRPAYAGAGLVEVATLDTHRLSARVGVKEHFGFGDGIGQPAVAVDRTAPGFVPAGVLAPDRADNTIAAGEFVFGHPNEYGQLPLAPAVPRDPTGTLPPCARGFDLGRNGTYLVVRQLEQRVAALWQFVRQAAGGDAAAVRLAAKMVGRWPSGAPLALAPDGDRAGLETSDAFGYATADPDGFACPFGAHARRANPRDALFPDDPTESVQESKRHRLIRRGRAYGQPLDPSLDPIAMMHAPDDGRERGLHFLCFNADIERQFEFVQHTWLGDPKFRGLWDDPDPLLGGRLASACAFVEQARPVRRRWTGLPSFVRVRGGAYCFMPGIRALRWLARLP